MRTKPLMAVIIGHCIVALALAIMGGIGTAPAVHADGGGPTPPFPPPGDSGYQAVVPDEPAEVDKTVTGDEKQNVPLWLVLELIVSRVI